MRYCNFSATNFLPADPAASAQPADRHEAAQPFEFDASLTAAALEVAGKRTNALLLALVVIWPVATGFEATLVPVEPFPPGRASSQTPTPPTLSLISCACMCIRKKAGIQKTRLRTIMHLSSVLLLSDGGLSPAPGEYIACPRLLSIQLLRCCMSIAQNAFL